MPGMLRKNKIQTGGPVLSHHLLRFWKSVLNGREGESMPSTRQNQGFNFAEDESPAKVHDQHREKISAGDA